MVSPKMPGGCSVRETILDDQSHGCGDHTVGVTASHPGEVGHVNVEVLLAAGAEMLREPEVQIHRPFRSRVAQIVQDSLLALVAIGAPVTVWTWPALVVAATRDDLWLG
jgi:hypothetical protein